jgi:hypothetical protein
LDNELTGIRLSQGFVATVAFPGESAAIDFWSFRYLLVTPAPNSHIALSGFVFPHPSIADVQQAREWGFQFIRNIDELTSARSCSFSFKNASGADVSLPGVSLGWAAQKEIVTAAPITVGKPGAMAIGKKPERTLQLLQPLQTWASDRLVDWLHPLLRDGC